MLDITVKYSEHFHRESSPVAFNEFVTHKEKSFLHKGKKITQFKPKNYLF